MSLLLVSSRFQTKNNNQLEFKQYHLDFQDGFVLITVLSLLSMYLLRKKFKACISMSLPFFHVATIGMIFW
jgi:hypothetical protein